MDVQQVMKIEFTRLRTESQLETRKPEKAKQEKAEVAPPPPDISIQKSSIDVGGGGDIGAIQTLVAQQTQAMGSLNQGGADRDAVPLVRIEPDYPMQARQRGIEGWVVVEFTISTAGTVKDPTVVASEPGTVFDRNAINAVRKWKYNPKMQDGKPVERPGVKVRLDFEMES
ncbi:MAG TPA: TonB family protein, partial [Myxococcota bacterium]|nr:TonB family protein [Myxococcota bacterium]